jgi:hypothetical protein
VGVVVQMDNRHEIVVKGNNNDGWSSDGMVLWLGRRQNEDMVESGSPRRVSCDGGADSMI